MANSNRYGAFSDLLSMRDAMNSLFDDSYALASNRSQAVSMPLDISETNHGFTVEVAVPGVKPEDIDITLQDNVLTISGETRQASRTGEKANYHRVERRYGRFARSISLPTQIQSEAVQAHMENGILRIELPKAEAVKPRKINVSTNNSLEGESLEVNNQQAREQGA